jgi:hypothetical protein
MVIITLKSPKMVIITLKSPKIVIITLTPDFLIEQSGLCATQVSDVNQKLFFHSLKVIIQRFTFQGPRNHPNVCLEIFSRGNKCTEFIYPNVITRELFA